MSRADVAIFIPTLGRPQLLAPLVKNLRASTDVPHVVYLIVEATDSATLKEIRDLQVKQSGVMRLINQRSASSAGAHNCAFSLTTEKYFFIGADDLKFGRHWLEDALARMTHDPGIGVVGTNDLHNADVLAGDFATHFLVRRSYIHEESGVWDQPSTVFHEGYKCWYSDKEFIELAKRRGRFAPCLTSVVEHLHPVYGDRVADATSTSKQRFIPEDEALYARRSAAYTAAHKAKIDVPSKLAYLAHGAGN